MLTKDGCVKALLCVRLPNIQGYMGSSNWRGAGVKASQIMIETGSKFCTVGGVAVKGTQLTYHKEDGA